MVTLKWSVSAAVAAALVLGGCTATGPDPRPDPTGPELRLVAFDSCDETLTALRDAVADDVGPYGFDGGAYGRDLLADAPTDARAAAPGAAPQEKAAAPEHSGTNNHEAGVDEADLVKTDGKRIVTVVDGVLRVLDAVDRRITGRLALTDAATSSMTATQLLLHGDRALVVATANGVIAYDGPARGGVADLPTPGGDPGSARLFLVDLAGTPRVAGSLTVDGAYVDARQVGGVARVVVRSWPRLPFSYPDGTRQPADTERANRAAVARSTAEEWLPRFTLEAGGDTRRGRVGCDQVVRPAEFSGRSMLTLYTFDLAADLTAGAPLTVVGDGETVYATGRTLYVAHQEYRRTPRRVAGERTTVHQFDLAGATRPRYAASGSVPGHLLNQYALSEHDGHLRVATTTTDLDASPTDRAVAPETASAVHVLRREGRELAEVGTVGGLGRGERIYAVRFAGPVGYVVTFRETDPVYTVDLRDPRRPKVTGELKIPGYSAYLHPVDDRTLIGVGQDATARGRRLGTQVSVFDVADPARPRRVSTYRVPGSGSEAEFDPHAFLYWPRTGTVVLPLTLHDTGFAPPEEKMRWPSTSGALVLSLRDGKLVERGTVRHPAVYGADPAIRRSLVIGGTLWTISAAGARADTVGGLAQQGWLPFG